MNGEEDSRWDFHVVTEFEIGGELNSLCRGNISVCYEYHICNWSTRKYGTTYKLADEINAAVLIGDGHDDTNWDKEDGTYS